MPIVLSNRTELSRFVLLSALVVGFCVLFAFEMVDAYNQAYREAIRSINNLSTAVALDLSRNIDLLDHSMKAVVEDWSNDEIRALKPSLRDEVLFDHAVSADHFGPLLVIDRFGSVLATSNQRVPLLESYAEREEFKVQAAQPTSSLFVSHPFRDSDGAWSIAFSRPLRDEAGGFAGAVIGTLRLSYLQMAFSHLNLGENGLMALFSASGVMIAREPMVEGAIGKTAGLLAIRDRIHGEESGTFEASSVVDGIHRIFSYHRVGDLPLYQYAAVSTRSVYAAFWQRAIVIGGMLLVLSSGTLMLLFSLKREFAARALVEAKLAQLASKDDLTGLYNRRAFSDLLDRAWRDGLERRRTVGLLMIDADHFKAYNDTHGHPAGDAVLRSIAAAIAMVAQSQGGSACRYGGEEFAVLLPATSTVRAMAAAEAIRQGVHSLSQAHGGSAQGRVTVSIGVVCVVPTPDMAVARLVAMADAQLYTAKARGRNCSSIARPELDDAA